MGRSVGSAKAVLLLASLWLAACGGGGGGGGDGGVATGTSPLLASVALLDLGEVPVGEAAEQTFTIRNPEAAAIRLATATVPGSSVELLSPSLPVDVPPGGAVLFRIRYEPPAVGVLDGTLLLRHEDPGLYVALAVRATSGGEEVTDFGTVPLDWSGRTPLLAVDVPADAVSLTVEGLGAPGVRIAVADLFGPRNRVYTVDGTGGDYTWREGQEVLSTTIPNTHRPDLDLVAGGGEYTFRLRRSGSGASSLTARAIVERRPGGDRRAARLDLNVWLGVTVGPRAATATRDSRLQAILASLDSVLRPQGIHVGAITYYDVGDPRYDFLADGELADLLRLTAAADDVRVNLFFLRQVFGSGVVGASPTVSGPARNGTGFSGLAAVYGGGLPASWVGAIAAHEIGHLLGLYHTVEQYGGFDIVEDTPECPESGASTVACPEGGGVWLMNWQFAGGTRLSSGQGKVLRAHPLLNPATGAAGGTEGTFYPRLEPGVPLPPGWCAVCGD